MKSIGNIPFKLEICNRRGKAEHRMDGVQQVIDAGEHIIAELDMRIPILGTKTIRIQMPKDKVFEVFREAPSDKD